MIYCIELLQIIIIECYMSSVMSQNIFKTAK
jgi:hypothetical protein